MAKILEKNVKIFSSFGREIIQSVHFGAETFFAWCGAVPDPKFFSLVRCGAVLDQKKFTWCAPKIWNPGAHRNIL